MNEPTTCRVCGEPMRRDGTCGWCRAIQDGKTEVHEQDQLRRMGGFQRLILVIPDHTGN